MDIHYTNLFSQTATWILWQEAFENTSALTTTPTLPLGHAIAPFNALVVDDFIDKQGISHPSLAQTYVAVHELMVNGGVTFSTSALGQAIEGRIALRRQICISTVAYQAPDQTKGSITLRIDSTAIGGKIPAGWIVLQGQSSGSIFSSASFSGGSLSSGDTIVLKGNYLYRVNNEEGGRYLLIPIIASPKITFDPNGGYLPSSELIRYKDAGEVLGTLPVPTREKCEFIGWFTSREGGEQVTESTIVPRSNITYYAHWKKTTVLVSMDARGGSVSPTVIEAEIGGTYGALPVPSRFLSQFDGWFTEPDGGGSKVTSESIVSIEEDHSLYAKWIIEEGKLIYSAAGNLILDDTSM